VNQHRFELVADGRGWLCRVWWGSDQVTGAWDFEPLAACAKAAFYMGNRIRGAFRGRITGVTHGSETEEAIEDDSRASDDGRMAETQGGCTGQFAREPVELVPEAPVEQPFLFGAVS
jgi:hypothetical protein